MSSQRAPVIDFHAHVLEPHVLEQATGRTVLTGFGAAPDPLRALPGWPMVGPLAKMLDPELQLEDMDQRGIDMHVLSSSTVIQSTAWAEADLQLELERRANDQVAEWVRRYPERFAGSFTLPLRDLRLALGELERAVGELGLRVANLPASVDGVYLGAPRFRPLWEAIREHGVVVFIHPDGVRDPWFQEYSLWNSVGQPIEESKVMASLIYEGVLEEMPDLTIVIAHGGGYLPHYFGRLDRNVTNMPDSARNITRKPSDYLRSFYFDTCLYDVTILEALVARVGADRLVMGGDYPVGEADPVGFVEGCGTLTAEEKALIAGGTAAAILGLGA